MGFRVLRRRGNAHQPFDRQPIGQTRRRDQIVGLIGPDAGLLWFRPRIDLNQDARRSAAFHRRLGQGAGQLFTIQRLDDIEQGDGVRRLVGLQRADQPQFQVGKPRDPGGPTRLRLLHPIFAEHPLAGRQYGVDRVGALSLGYGGQGDVMGIAPGRATGGVDAGADLCDPFGDGRRGGSGR